MGASGWTTAEHIFRDLLIFVAVMTALLVALVVVVSVLRESDPLRRIFSALSYRVGATAAFGALALPMEPIPGLGEIYEAGAPILLLWYRYTFVRDLRKKKTLPEVQSGLEGRSWSRWLRR